MESSPSANGDPNENLEHTVEVEPSTLSPIQLRQQLKALLQQNALLASRADDDADERKRLQIELQSTKLHSEELSSELISATERLEFASAQDRDRELLDLHERQQQQEYELQLTEDREAEEQEDETLRLEQTRLTEIADLAEKARIAKERIITAGENASESKSKTVSEQQDLETLSGSIAFDELTRSGIFATQISQQSHVAISVLTNHAEFRNTDPDLANDNNTSSAVAYIEHQCGSRGSRTVKLICEAFEKVICNETSTTEEIQKAITHFLQLTTQTLSFPSAGRALLYLASRKFISGEDIKTSKRISDIIHAYALTADSDTTKFEKECKRSCIDHHLLQITLPIHPPGFQRLNSTNRATQKAGWIAIVKCIMTYLLCDRALRTRSEEDTLHNLNRNPSLYMQIADDGTVEKVPEWQSRYHAVLTRLQESAKFLEYPKLIPDDYEKNLLVLRAAPTELRMEIYRLLKYDQRWPSTLYHEQKEGSALFAVPKLDFAVFEKVLEAAYENFKIYPQNGKTEDKQRAVKTEKTKEDKKKKQEKVKKSKRGGKVTDPCSLCKSTDHQSATCNQMTPDVEACNNFQRNRCIWGMNCMRRHNTLNGTGIAGDPCYLPTAMPTQSQTTETAEWVACVCQDCNKEHFENATFWNGQVGRDGKPWGLPPRCKACRDAHKLKRSNPSTLPVAAAPAPVDVPLPPPVTGANTTQQAPPNSLAVAMTGGQFSCLHQQLDDEELEDADDDYDFAMVVSVGAHSDSDDSEEEYDDYVETPGARIETERWEKRMKVKHEPHSIPGEVGNLQVNHCTPAARKRVSKPAERLVQSGAKLLMTGRDPILPDELQSALYDQDVDSDSIDLSEGDEEPSGQQDLAQHSIKSFFKSSLIVSLTGSDTQPDTAPRTLVEHWGNAQVNTTTQASEMTAFDDDHDVTDAGIEEVEEECVCGEAHSFDQYCEKCLQCHKCCGCVVTIDAEPLQTPIECICGEAQSFFDEYCNECSKCNRCCECIAATGTEPGQLTIAETCSCKQATVSFDGQCTRCMACPDCCTCNQKKRTPAGYNIERYFRPGADR